MNSLRSFPGSMQSGRAALRLAVMCTLLSACQFSVQARQASLAVLTPGMEVRFTSDGDLHSIHSRYRDRTGRWKTGLFTGENGSVLLAVAKRQPESPAKGADEGWEYGRSENDSVVLLTFRRHGISLTYTVLKGERIVDVSMSACASSAAEASLRRPDMVMLPGIMGQEKKRFVITEEGRVRENRPWERPVKTGVPLWFGTRSRFWTVMACPLPGKGTAGFSGDTLIISGNEGIKTAAARLYAGPIVYRELRAAGSECTGLLYPLWFWIRWLSFGLGWIFDLLLAATRNPAVAVIALSVCVKIITAPLYAIANRWQRQVNRQSALLQPLLDEINSSYKGEEHNRRTLAAYRELGIHPLYSLKSLGSAAIQIPVFFAAYHTLSEHIALEGIPFLWIENLAAQDRLFNLPFSLPYFGGDFNLLPLIMTAITIASSRIHADLSITPALFEKRRRSLYLMAALFLLLLYHSPAGMVLYWTMNNALAFISTLFETGRSKRCHIIPQKRGSEP